jgi:hypothetical protein
VSVARSATGHPDKLCIVPMDLLALWRGISCRQKKGFVNFPFFYEQVASALGYPTFVLICHDHDDVRVALIVRDACALVLLHLDQAKLHVFCLQLGEPEGSRMSPTSQPRKGWLQCYKF